MSWAELGRRLWNCDETGICTGVASRKLLARRGEKNVHEVGGGSGRDYITILACGSAFGERLPPYVVYKGKNLMSNHTQGGPPGTRYSMSDSGWMETANFHEWFLKVFVPATRELAKTGPVVLGTSHMTHLLLLSWHENIILFCMYFPHMQHIFSNPLMLGYLGHLNLHMVPGVERV